MRNLEQRMLPPPERLLPEGEYDHWNLARKVYAARDYFTQRSAQLEADGVYKKNIQKILSAEKREIGKTFVNDIGTQALHVIADINQSLEHHHDPHPYYDKRDAFITEVILAMRAARDMRYENAFPGVRVSLQEYFREEPFHEDAANRVTVRIPHPEKTGEHISVYTSLDKVATHIRRALHQNLKTSEVVYRYLKDIPAEPEHETEDEFLIRKAYEVMKLNERIRSQRPHADPVQIQHLQDRSYWLSIPVLDIWLDRKARPRGNESHVDLQVGYLAGDYPKRDRLSYHILPEKGKPIFFDNPPPWQIAEISAKHHATISKIIATGHDFDFMVGNS